MATPTFTHDLTTIANAETATGWLLLTNMTPSLDPDTFIQGSNSIGVPSTANTLVGATFDVGAGLVNLTGKHLFIWVKMFSIGAIASFAAGGVRIRVSTSSAADADFGEWYVGGRDIVWCAEGWRLICIDTSRPFNNTGGTPPADMTSIRRIGVTALTTITLMFGFAINIDIMRYGTKFGVSGGTDGDPVTLQSIFDQDFEVDPVNNVFGIVTKNKAGTFEVNGELRIGIESGAGNTVFSSQNELVIFQDQPCALDYLKIKSQQGTGTTKVKLGTGSGIGDARVGVSGSVFDRINSVHGREYSLDLVASITLVEFYGSTVLRAKRAVKLPAAAGHEAISSSFVSCGQVDLGQALTRKCTFSGHGLTDTGATTLSVAANAVNTGLITVTVAVARTYTRSAGSYITDGFAVGMVVTWSGFTNAVNNGKKVIESLTATVMTVAPSQTLVAETGDANEQAIVAFGYTRAAGSFLTDGFAADHSIEVSGFTTSGNNGTRVITTVGATLITVNLDTGMAAETGGGDERIQRSGITGDGALLWNANIDIKNSSFLGNTNSPATADAIQHAATGTFTYDNLTFSGNNFDIHNSSAGLVTINASNGANPSTFENTGGGSTVTNNTKTLTITVKDNNTTAIQGAQVWIQKDPSDTDFGHEAKPFTSAAGNNAGDADFVVSEAIPSDLPSSGFLSVIGSSGTHTYRYASKSGSTFTFNAQVTGTDDGTGNTTTINETGIGAKNIVEGDTIVNTTETPDQFAVVLSVSANSVTTTTLSGGASWAGDSYSVHRLAINYSTSDKATVPLMNEETNASGVATESYNFGSSKAVIIRIRKATSGTKYIPYSTTGTITGDFNLTATLTTDTIA